MFKTEAQKVLQNAIHCVTYDIEDVDYDILLEACQVVCLKKVVEFTIPLPPVSKKNSGQIVNTGSRPRLLPSKAYREYERDAGWYLTKYRLEIDYPINIKATYYMPTRHKVDITNLESALCDVLAKYKVLADDNCKIVVARDGSRVSYDKQNPRTEVEIFRL